PRSPRPPPPHLRPLSLHDALPISPGPPPHGPALPALPRARRSAPPHRRRAGDRVPLLRELHPAEPARDQPARRDRPVARGAYPRALRPRRNPRRPVLPGRVLALRGVAGLGAAAATPAHAGRLSGGSRGAAPVHRAHVPALPADGADRPLPRGPRLRAAARRPGP